MDNYEMLIMIFHSLNRSINIIMDHCYNKDPMISRLSKNNRSVW